MEIPEMKFVMLRYPHWRCQLIKPQKIETLDKLSSGISLELNKVLLEHSPTRNIKGIPTNQTKEITEKRSDDSPVLQFLLMDPVNSPLIFPENFQMKGDRIAVPFELGWRIFTIKIHRFQHLKEDPHFDCEEYDEGKTYGACVRQELKGVFKKVLNCTPPLLMEEPDDDDDFCSQRFNVTEQEGNRIRDLFESHFNLFKPSSCKKPCTRTTYEVQSMEVLKYPAPYIGLSFDSTVELTETKFRNNFVTLLTGLGGSVKQLNDQFKHLSIKFIF